MTLENIVSKRAKQVCELCKGHVNLQIMGVPAPHIINEEETSILLCEVCRDQIDGEIVADHWFPLSEAIWSEVDVVKVMANRILKRMPESPFAQNLLDQMYVDTELKNWVDHDVGQIDGSDVIDSNGAPLQQGDSVTLIKDLVVKGAKFTAKRGTMVKNITLTNDSKFVEGKINGMKIVLVAEYLKKA